MPHITEDDLYRASTQYRSWSFTRDSLASLRATTNAGAAEGVRAAINNVRIQKTKSDTNEHGNGAAVEVDCLTVEEEQRLVAYYCFKTMQFADHYKFGTSVKVCFTLLVELESRGHSTDYIRLQLFNISSVSTSLIPQ